MRCPTRRSLASLACLLSLAAASAFGQAPEPKVRSVTFYKVQPGRSGEFLAAIKEWAALMQKGGSERYYHVWSAQSGAAEFAVVSHHQKWAELDAGPEEKMKEHAGALAALRARIGATIDSTRREITALEPELSLPTAGVAPPTMLRVIRTWVRPEHNDAYRALVKAELLPAAKKAGLKLWSTSRVRFGGSAYEYVSASSVANWAEMDGEAPIVQALGGQAGYQKYLAKQRPMVSRSEYQMYRLMKDHSYMPPAK